ncbi:N-acetyltransferase [Halomonas cupida]|uniref:N-acetyltransferase n=1 Tax=Halomonas cupida TaxID=44933 RepID=A0A1M7BCS5_9GAMM|nr:GNAT family N-acetyltransferase [Halomonas cupida]GEN22053.1 N-acetyltransferase [Halomonas cupida]SHL52810.1 Protein N-acetyltransferase, RimJ/RimL family [Halomonas cupida]
MPIYQTQRLGLRHLSLDDLPALNCILSDPEVMRFSIRGVCDEQATRRFIEGSLLSYARDGFGPWAVVANNTAELLGFCGIGHEPVGGRNEISLGYRLAKQQWGKGLATEAAEGALNLAFTRFELPRIVCLVEPENRASLRVAEKVGFQQFSDISFHRRPVRCYRMTRHDWLGTHPARG